MKHVFFPASSLGAPTIVLFHGTGGNEEDLVPLGRRLDPGAALLGLRGQVLENGQARFFRRLAEGVFDEEDLVRRTEEVSAFLDEGAVRYGLDRNRFAAVGYSNGANIVGSLLFHVPGVLRAAILLHPMVPRRGLDLPDLTGLSVFVGAGTNDPLCPVRETEELTDLLRAAGAKVTVHWENFGHRISGPEIEAAAAWYQEALPF